MFRIDALQSGRSYDIAIQGTNHAGEGTLSSHVVARTQTYEKRPLVVGFLERKEDGVWSWIRETMKSVLYSCCCCNKDKTPNVYVLDPLNLTLSEMSSRKMKAQTVRDLGVCV